MDKGPDGLKLISDHIREGLCGAVPVSVLMGANVANEVARDELCESTVRDDFFVLFFLAYKFFFSSWHHRLFSVETSKQLQQVQFPSRCPSALACAEDSATPASYLFERLVILNGKYCFGAVYIFETACNDGLEFRLIESEGPTLREVSLCRQPPQAERANEGTRRHLSETGPVTIHTRHFERSQVYLSPEKQPTGMIFAFQLQPVVVSLLCVVLGIFEVYFLLNVFLVAAPTPLNLPFSTADPPPL